MNPRLREAGPEDQPIIDAALWLAVHWASAASPRADEPLGEDARRYAAGFGRSGDYGVVAEVDGEPAGAAWWRCFSTRDHGYGFVDETVPELSLAVWPGFRRRGLGRTMVRRLQGEAARRALPGLSLSVEADNPARPLYLAEGFERVGDVENAWTMLWRPRSASGR